METSGTQCGGISSFLSLPQQQTLLGKVEGWLPALFQGKTRKAKHHKQVIDQKTQGPQGREAHLWLAGLWGSGREPGFSYTQEGPSLTLCLGRGGEDGAPQPSQQGEALNRPL